MTMIRVINPGMYTTVQDLGRKGFQQYGMPISGSMDEDAHTLANLLVGNAPAEAVLEMTFLGGSYEFQKDTFIAITGANMEPKLNGQRALAMWRTIGVCQGDVLTLGAAVSGCRAYLAVAGGLNIEPVLGSRSTYVRGNLGGVQGRPLKKEDVVPLREHGDLTTQLTGRFIRPQYIPDYATALELRVILGPQEDAFTRKGIADFFSETFKVSKDFDRMGYRLEGKKVEHVESADIISDGIVKGAVQVPGHGNPIIMLADCQTTGGYTKIAHVITSDLWKIAQAKAGDSIGFKAIEVEEAHGILAERVERLKTIEADFETQRLEAEQDWNLRVNGKSYTVKINTIASA